MTSAGAGDAHEQVLAELAALGPLRGLSNEVREYPLRLLRLAIDLHAQWGRPVPDHLLKLPAYLGETALRALVEGGFLDRVDDPLHAINAYAPTASGLALAREAADAAKPGARKKRA